MHTAFLIFLIILVTTASAGRSFSKLKLIKTYLRNFMGHERRNLAILSIEHSKARNVNFDDVINTFAEKRNFNNKHFVLNQKF